MRRIVMLSVAALTVVFVLSYTVPAVGGPSAFSSASPAKLAKRALKTSRKADRRSKQALAKFSGVLGTNIQTVTSAPVTIAPGAVGSGSVACPAGTVVISGGFLLAGAEGSVFFDRRSGNGWAVGVDNLAAADAPGLPSAQVTIEAQCARTAAAATSAANHSAPADRLRDRRVVRRWRAAHQR